MANANINKVVYGGNTLIDLTNDTITRADVINTKSFHLADGSTTTGTCLFDANTRDATAVAGEILTGKTAYKNGTKVTGNMPNRGSQVISVTSIDNNISINNGYHDGSGYAQIDATEAAKITSDNIRKGVTILGVVGDLTGDELVSVTTVAITPKTSSQTVVPTTYSDTTGNPYDYFAQFTVNAIPYVETDNAAGGKTATIAGS